MTLLNVKNNVPSKSFNNLMNDFFIDTPSLFSTQYSSQTNNFPAVNIAESEGGYILNLVAPGFEKENFTIKLEKNLLTLSAEKTTESKNEKNLRTEYEARSFKRSFTIDENIDVENISAKYNNGVLMLTLPKKENIKAAAKKITIA